MQNPYKKPTKDSIQHHMTDGSVFFPQGSTCRWSWFEITKEYWSSSKRIKFNYAYSRDYAYEVFERYIRRFGYLSIIQATEYNDRLMKRWNWFSKAQVHVPEQRKYRLPDIDNEFCPIGYIGHVSPYNNYIAYDYCKYCGAKTRVKRGFTLPGIDKYHVMKYNAEINIWIIRGAGAECTNALCRESIAFMDNKHSLIESAKILNIQPKRKLSKYRNSEPKDKIVIAAASLLDFEARYKQRFDKLTKQDTN